MLNGDLGRYHVSIAITKRIIGLWFNLVSNENKLSITLNKLMYNDHLKTITHISCWTMLNLYLMNVVLVLFGEHTVVMARKNYYVIELKCR